MNSQEYRNLQEAYLNVYEQEETLDEKVLGQDPESRKAGSKERKSGNKRLPPSSGKGYADNQKKSISYMNKLTKNNKIIPGMAHEEVEEFDEGIGSAIKGLFAKKKKPEPQKPESRGAELRQKYGTETSPKRQILDKTREKAEKDEKEYGDSTYSKSVSTKSRAAHDKYLKAGYSKYRATGGSGGQGGSGEIGSGNKARKRAAALNNSYDLFDYMMEYLISEGYADTNENALVIMTNMSEGWKNNILEARVDDSLSDEEKQDARNKRSGGQSDFTRRNLTKAGRGKSPKGMKPPETTTAMTSMRKYEMALNQPNTRMGRSVRDNIAMDKAERGPSGRRGS